MIMTVHRSYIESQRHPCEIPDQAEVSVKAGTPHILGKALFVSRGHFSIALFADFEITYRVVFLGVTRSTPLVVTNELFSTHVTVATLNCNTLPTIYIIAVNLEFCCGQDP